MCQHLPFFHTYNFQYVYIFWHFSTFYNLNSQHLRASYVVRALSLSWCLCPSPTASQLHVSTCRGPQCCCEQHRTIWSFVVVEEEDEEWDGVQAGEDTQRSAAGREMTLQFFFFLFFSFFFTHHSRCSTTLLYSSGIDVPRCRSGGLFWINHGVQKGEIELDCVSLAIFLIKCCLS